MNCHTGGGLEDSSIVGGFGLDNAKFRKIFSGLLARLCRYGKQKLNAILLWSCADKLGWKAGAVTEHYDNLFIEVFK